MRFNNIIILFALGLLVSSCSKKVYTSIGWQTKPVVADGKPKEWDIPLRYYDSESKLQYTFTNDAQNLYICIRSTDNTETNKILQAGMQVWIDTSAEKQERTGIMFPTIQQAQIKKDNGDSQQAGQTKPDQGQQNQGQPAQSYNQGAQNGTAQPAPKYNSSSHGKSAMLKNQQQMMLKGFKTPIGGYTPVRNDYGIEAGITVDSTGILFYELVIPFITFYHNLTPADTVKNINIELVVNALQAKEGKGNHSNSESGGSGGGGMRGGGMGGGGMGGGMRGGGMGGGGMRGGGSRGSEANEQANEKTNLWRGIKFSYKANQ